MPKTLSTLLGCVLFFIVLLAQDQRGNAHIGVDEGLSQGTVFGIVQDHNGFIWIATADGLNRFDGYTITTFKNIPGVSASLQHTNLRNLFLAKDALWITTGNSMELYRMDLLTQKIRLVHAFMSDSIDNGEVLPFRADGDTIWVAAAGYGVVKLDANTGKILQQFSQAVNVYALTNVMTYDSARAELWYVETGSKSVSCFSLLTGEIRRRSFDDPNTGEALPLYSLTLCADKKILFGTTQAVVTYDPLTHAVTYNALPVQPDGTTELICALMEAGDNRFWCGTSKGSVYVFDEADKTFALQSNPQINNSTLPYRAIRFMMDQTRNLWIATDPNGLFRIDTKRKPFHHVYSDPENRNGLRSNFTKCFLQSGDEFFIGTYDQGLNVLNRKDGTFRYINGLDNATGNLPSINAMTEDSSGTIWVSTAEGITMLPKGETHLRRPNLLRDDTRTSTHVQCIYLLNDQSLLLGSYGGFCELKKNGDVYECIPYPVGDFAQAILVDREGNLWVGSAKGLYFAGKDEPRNTLALKIDNIGTVKSICQDNTGAIWVGSNSGLYKIDTALLRIEKMYSEKDGMPNNFVYGILTDEENNLWLSTNKGISKFNPAQETFRNYTVSDNLQSNEFNTGAYYKNAAGELFFGGVNGYNHFFPEEIKDNPYAPRAVITAFKIFDKPFVSDTSIEYRKQIVLDYTENNLLLEYTALEFSDPARNTFSYRMTGLDSNWVEAGKERFARFVNLDPGEYIFELRAANNDGVWNTEITELRITIIPPFWQTGTFFILVIATGLILAVAAIRFYLRRQLRIRTREMTLKQNVRMNAILETEEKERKRIAEELHDGLGQLLSTARLNVAGFEDSIETKDRTRLKNSLDLLDEACAEVRAISHNMMPGALIRLGLVDAVNELVNKISDTEKIKAEFDTNLEERFPETTEVALYRIVQEVLNNVVRHARAKTVVVKMRKTNGMLEVDIADDGRSFDVAQIAKSQGLGWKNIYSRVEILNGTIRVESEEGNGTRIFIAIPLN